MKNALVDLGHDVLLVSSGDDFKKFDYDINIKHTYKGYLGKFLHLLKPLLYYRKLVGYDFVQYITPFYHDDKYTFLLRWILRKNANIFYLSSGCDSIYASRSILKDMCRSCLKKDQKKSSCYLLNEKYFDVNNKYLSFTKAIIPISNSYHDTYRKSYRVTNPIRLPIKPSRYRIKSNLFNQTSLIKFIFTCSKSRKGFKGFDKIKKAFDIISKKYNNEVYCELGDVLPFDQYVDKLRGYHVVVDQFYGGGIGLNTLFCASMGNIVLAPYSNPYKSSDDFKLGSDCPFLFFKSEVDSLVSCMEFVIKNKNLLKDLSQQYVDYVEKYHNPKTCALELLKTWKKHS